jgi:hypothetical protein
MTDRELMQQALDALEKHVLEYETAEALRARLAQPEPEPVAWHEPGAYGNVTVYKKWADENGWVPLYTAPPQREWQGLTEDEVLALGKQYYNSPVSLMYAVEAKLKEKNHG